MFDPTTLSRLLFWGLAASLGAGALGAEAQADADACKEILPAAAAGALERSYPRYRLPREVDNPPEERELNRQAGGNACVGIAQGKFTGKDVAYAVLLTKRQADQTLLVVVIPEGRGWRTRTLRRWGPGRSRLFVRPLPAGTYERVPSLHGSPLEWGETTRVTSQHEAIVSCYSESCGVGYFYQGRSWRHVWISD